MKTTFSRSLTTVAIVLLVGLLLVGVSLQVLVKDFLTDQTVEGLKKDAKVIAELVQAYTEDLPFSNRDFSIALTVAASVSGADAVICNAEGELVICASDPLGCEHTGLMVDKAYLQRTFTSGGCVDTGLINHLYSDMRYVVSMPIQSTSGRNIGIVIVSSPIEQTVQIMARITEIFVFVSILVVLISVIVMVIYFQRQSAPLRAMARAASDFGHGKLTARVKTGGNHSEEVEELALAFNNMASSLQKSEYQRQEFVANVSHELKTPMTTISGYVDGMLDKTIPAEKWPHYLQIVSDETKRLSRLVRSMLDISQLQTQEGIPEEKKVQFDLEDASSQVLLTFEKKIDDKHINVEVDMPDHPVFTFANEDYITQVIYNLIDNAVKFCPDGGTLGLKIKEGGAKAYGSVSNDGDTIPPEELPLVFDRFHKLDKSRSKNRDGWGLGLYIVKTIVCAHGENISVTSRDGKTEFTFTMPLVN